MLNGICTATHIALSYQFLWQNCLFPGESRFGIDFSVPLSGGKEGQRRDRVKPKNCMPVLVLCRLSFGGGKTELVTLLVEEDCFTK